MPDLLLHDDQPVAVDILARVPDLILSIDGRAHRVLATPSADPHAFSIELDGVVHTGFVYRTADSVHVRLPGRTVIFAVPRRDGGSGGAAGNEIRADMPGVVVSVECRDGDAAAAGTKLMTIESMKLQTTISAPRDVVIDRVHVAPDAAFDRGAVLISFRRPEEKAA